MAPNGWPCVPPVMGPVILGFGTAFESVCGVAFWPRRPIASNRRARVCIAPIIVQFVVQFALLTGSGPSRIDRLRRVGRDLDSRAMVVGISAGNVVGMVRHKLNHLQ